ncbi:MAG: hypothetical protein NTZ46_06995 [Verrucomicrobia bacterium]|nr:hypothetical protein [Verrucomicrobiota bacterium]
MTDPVIVSTLIGHRDVGTGLTCLPTLAKHSCEPVRFQLHDDGSLTENDREQLLNQLPVHAFISRRQADAIVNERLSHYPRCARYRRHYAYGFKLFDTLMLAPGEDLAFCDTDIFFLRPFAGLFSWPDQETGALMMQDYQNAYAFRPWHLAMQRQLEMPARINSGLFFFRRRHFDLDFIEWLMKRNEAFFESRAQWVEQTSWSALGWRCGGRVWSEKQIRVMRDEASFAEELVAAHFVTPVRGLLPMAAARSREGCEPVQIPTEPMQRLHPLGLLQEQASQFWRRKIGRPA